MRLLRAELITLNRPLTWAVATASTLFCVLLAIGGASNARQSMTDAAHPPLSCAALRLPAGPSCTYAQDMQRQRAKAERATATAAAARTAAQLDPLAAGAEAAGLTASLPGAVALALLAGGHVGGEWSGRTLKHLLTQNGRRHRIMAAKLAGLWGAAVCLLCACWAGLAAAGPVIRRVEHLPDPHQPARHALTWAGAEIGRSLLVLAAFAAIGLLAGVVTRGAIGTAAAGTAAVIAMLIAAALPGLGRWTPATWIQGWMGFAAGQGSISSLPDNFWSRFISADGTPPGHGPGLIGVSALFLVCALAAMQVFRRLDVTG
ncbi:hypothetical protein [Streptomyces sp. NPDC020917]|uniref:hypothetical protein n=1 Tax=Streptomyces sp. NPDC020917 TaxID=3365102 RepID=UPI0037938B45